MTIHKKTIVQIPQRDSRVQIPTGPETCNSPFVNGPKARLLRVLHKLAPRGEEKKLLDGLIKRLVKERGDKHG